MASSEWHRPFLRCASLEAHLRKRVLATCKASKSALFVASYECTIKCTIECVKECTILQGVKECIILDLDDIPNSPCVKVRKNKASFILSTEVIGLKVDETQGVG